MSALGAIMYREGKIRATNLTFIFWDLFYPLGYLLVFGVGMTQAMGMTAAAIGVDYNAFFLAGVLGMASFGIASNTAWSFFMDRDNGIFYEMLTYPMRRSEYLLGKGLFNLLSRSVRPSSRSFWRRLSWTCRSDGHLCRCWPLRCLSAPQDGFSFMRFLRSRFGATIVFNTVTLVFYFVLLFASSMFYPVEPLPHRCGSCHGQTRSRGTWTCFAMPRLASAIRRWSGSKPPRSCFSPAAFHGALWALKHQ